MPIKCAGCDEIIKDSYYMKCSKCKGTFDFICLNLSKDKYEKLSKPQRDAWWCPSCVCSRPKCDNTSTPIRSASIPAQTNDTDSVSCNNINLQRGSRSQVTKNKSSKDELPTSSDLSTIISEMRQLRQEVTEVKKQNAEIKNQMSTISDHLSQTLNEHSKLLKNSQLEINSLKSTVAILQQQLAMREQEDMKNDLEITGLAEHDNENLSRIVIATSQKIGIELTDADINDVVRVGPKRRKTTKDFPNQKALPRPIIVKLLRKHKREQLLKAAKSRRNVTSENVVDGQPSSIFINERLTKVNRQLFRHARYRAKDHEYRYCWVRDGGIFVRKADGKQAVRINDMSDLDKYVGPSKELQI